MLASSHSAWEGCETEVMGGGGTTTGVPNSADAE